ncbi:MAG: class I SAM-dependent methyltransferase [Rhodospirillales bacterium]|nr:class I SAM-dependent methyltransferase [Rhodospirillales bacterium]
MTRDDDFEEINEAKANLDHIYDQPDPRAYFRELKKLRYAIPGAAKPIFQKLISSLQQRRDDTVCVLDLGCSYGVNAALLKHDLSMSELYHHWGQEGLADASPEKIVDCDRRFFDNLDEPEDIEVIGLDQAENAVEYAKEVGLLDEGFVVNLEKEPLSEPAKEGLAPVDLVVSTGCVGYVTEDTFDQLLPAITPDRLPWLANFVLRIFPFDAIEETLNERGYVTEKLEDRTFVQRRFASANEQEQVLEQLHEQGVEPTDKEAAGHLHAEFYLSRPKQDVTDVPIEQLLAG